MSLFKKIDWFDLSEIEKYLNNKNEPYVKIDKRPKLAKYRLEHEALARKSICYLMGDALFEKHPDEKYPDEPELKNLFEKELDLLKKAKERKVDVKILARFDASAPNLTSLQKRYIDEGIDIRTWGGQYRGGIYDNTEMYIISRRFVIPPSELTPEMAELLPRKIVGESQKDEDVPLNVIVTKCPNLIKEFEDIFEQEYKSSKPMKEDLERLEKAAIEQTTEQKSKMGFILL